MSNVGIFVSNTIIEKLEPKLKSKLDKKGLTKFRFENIDLGSVPPRVTGIKVHDKNVSQNEIVIDLDLDIKSNCDISFVVNTP